MFCNFFNPESSISSKINLSTSATPFEYLLNFRGVLLEIGSKSESSGLFKRIDLVLDIRQAI